jgi:hypothetical protein
MAQINLNKLFRVSDFVGISSQFALKHKYEKGLFVSINNHKTGIDEIIKDLRDYYKTIEWWLFQKNPSMLEIQVDCGKAPSRQRVMDIIAKKGIFVVAGIHNYDRHNHKTGRGSKYNIDYQHLHFIVYGSHHYLPDNSDEIQCKEVHLKKLLMI